MSSEEEEESSLDEDEDMPGLESVSSSEVGINHHHHHHTSNPSRARASSVVNNWSECSVVSHMLDLVCLQSDLQVCVYESTTQLVYRQC